MNTIYPIFAMSGLTVFCLLRLGFLRYQAVKQRQVDPRFFSLYRGYEEPEKLAVHSRHVINHFETPVLFYVICLVAYVTDQSGILLAGLAWAYVALRCVHSYVHLTSNVVLIRFNVFILSMIVLVALWLTVLAGVLRQETI